MGAADNVRLMTRSKARSGDRPDLPSEAARRAIITAKRALGRARGYLVDSKGQDSGDDFSHLVEALDRVLSELEDLWEVLKGVAAVDPTPESFFPVMQRVDQAFVDVIVETFIEEHNPILHGPQAEVRVMVQQARGDV